MKLSITAAVYPDYATKIVRQFALDKWAEHNPDLAEQFELVYEKAGLSLYKKDEPKMGAIIVDFVTGAAAHRRKFGGGKGQAIAKAVGLNKGVIPAVLDATAGLGRDAFVLASLGCEVQLYERHPVVAALLYDGLQRAYLDSEIGTWMQQRMRLVVGASQALLPETSQQPDVVYLDPMYPHKSKSAQVKKEMRVFQTLVGSDTDASELLNPALQLAGKRVVVKRPDYAEDLANQAPTMRIETKKNRFDVYVLAGMTDK